MSNLRNVCVTLSLRPRVTCQIYRVHTAPGKQGKWPKKTPCQGKQMEFGNLAKTQGIWFSQDVNSLILKIKDILTFAEKISFFFFKAG